MGTTSGSQKRERTVTNLSQTTGTTGKKETLKVTPAAALVEVYARSGYDGPDTLVLRSTDGDSASNRTYHKELTVKNQKQKGDLIECAFTLDEQQGTAKKQRDLYDQWYTLGWRPTGKRTDEIILFESELATDIWNFSGLSGAGQERTVMASMTTARFQECSELQFPAEGGELDVDLPDKLKTAYEPLGEDRSAVFPEPDPESSTPVKSRSGDWSPSGESDGNVPGAKSPEIDPPPGDRWVAVYGQFATGEDDYAPAPTLVGAYKVTEGGKYKRAKLSGSTPSASGPTQADVLLPAGHVGSGQVNLFARLALGSPSTERLRQGEKLLQRGGIDREDLIYATTPMFFGEPVPGRAPTPQDSGAHPADVSTRVHLHEPARHIADSDQGPGMEAYLVNPLWAAERRVQALEAAHEHYREWMKKVGVTEGHAGLVGDLCYNPSHGRGYLADRLADAPTEVRSAHGRMQGSGAGRQQVKKEYDMKNAWSPFEPDQVSSSGQAGFGRQEKHDQLGQFQYGLQCKRAFLVWNRNRAGDRASMLLGSPYLYQSLLDLFSASSAPAGLGDRAVEWFVRLVLNGGRPPVGDGAVSEMIEASQLQSPSLDKVTGMSSAAVLLKVGTKTAGYKLALAMGPRVVANWESNTGMRQLADFYMRLAHGPDGYTNAATDSDEIRLVPTGGEKAEVSVTKKAVGPEGNKKIRYRMTVDGAVKRKMKQSMGDLKTDTIGSATAGLRVLTGIVSIYSVTDALSKGEVGVGEALNLGTIGLEIAALYEESPSYSAMMKGKVPTWLGPTLEVLGPVADVTLGAWQLGQAATDTQARGQATVDDPDVAGAVGAVLGVAGGIALTVGTGGTALVAGAALTALGGGASLYGDWSDWGEIEAADPLSDWLPTKDFWGRDFGGDRTPLFTAVRPDPSTTDTLSGKTVGGKPLPNAMKDQSEALTERAFYFPTGVGVRTPDEGATPVGLKLDIAVAYLPSYGTLMVDATVLDPGTGEKEPIRCAVHYVKSDGDFRYCVVPEKGDKRLTLSEKVGVSDHVDEQQWAWAPMEPVRLPEGEEGQAARLQVHVGEWPTGWYEKQTQQVAEKQLKLYRSRPRPGVGVQEEWVRKDGLQKARQVAREVAPNAHWEGPSGLGAILQSGQFTVSGSVYFRPLQPLNPDPTIPSEESSELYARMDIGGQDGFTYPNDAQ